MERLCGGWFTGEVGRVPIVATPETALHVYERPELQQQLVDIGFPGCRIAIPIATRRRYSGLSWATVRARVSTGKSRRPGWRRVSAETILPWMAPECCSSRQVFSPAKTKRALEAIRAVVDELHMGQSAKTELRRAKTKLLSRLVMSGESTNSRMLSLCGSWVSLGRLETLEEEAAQIDAVTLDDIYRLRERIPLDAHQVTVTLGPVSGQALA